MAKLVASRAGAALGSWFIERERVVIGRAEGAGIRLEDQAVSKQHAAIEMAGNDHILQDLGSANGTFVNGTRVTPISCVTATWSRFSTSSCATSTTRAWSATRASAR